MSDGLVHGGPLALSSRQTPPRMYYPGATELRQVSLSAVMVGAEVRAMWPGVQVATAPDWRWVNGDLGLYDLQPSPFAVQQQLASGWNLVKHDASDAYPTQYPPVPGVAPPPDEASSLSLSEPPQGPLSGGTVSADNPNGDLSWYNAAGSRFTYFDETLMVLYLSALPLNTRLSGPDIDSDFSGWDSCQLTLHLTGGTDLTGTGYQAGWTPGGWSGTEHSLAGTVPRDIAGPILSIFDTQAVFDNSNLPTSGLLTVSVGNQNVLASVVLDFTAEFTFYYHATLPGGRPKALARPRGRRVNFDPVAPIAVG